MTLAEPEHHAPVDAVKERLNDPAVAGSLVTLLDNAELLSTLVLGLSGFVSRGEMIMDAMAEGVNDFKAAGGHEDLPSAADVSNLVAQLRAVSPALTSIVNSPMVEPATIELLGTFSEAATEGMDNARSRETAVTGLRDAFKAIKDPDVQRGLGLLIEVARSLGQRVENRT